MNYIAKKMISYTLLCGMLASTVLSMTATAVSTSRIYLRHNYDEHSTIESTTYPLYLDDFESSTSTYIGVIGEDTRYRDGDTGIVRLTSGSTGFVVGDHVIATCAHCVYNRNTGEWIENYKIRMYDSEGVPTTVEYDPVEAHIPQTYVSNSSDMYDYALITVAQDLSEYAHFNLGSLYDLDAQSLENVNLYATGIPGQVHGEENGNFGDTGQTGRKVYTGIGHIVDVANSNSEILYLDADITPGDSGGPIYMQETYCIGLDVYRINTVVSICAGMSNSGLYNLGPRFNSTILQFYHNNPNINY